MTSPCGSPRRSAGDRPEVEVVVIDGGQPVYPLLLGVE